MDQGEVWVPAPRGAQLAAQAAHLPGSACISSPLGCDDDCFRYLLQLSSSSASHGVDWGHSWHSVGDELVWRGQDDCTHVQMVLTGGMA